MQDFSNNGGYTMLPLDPTQLNALGQNSELSFYDHQIVNRAYCNGMWTLTSDRKLLHTHFILTTSSKNLNILTIQDCSFAKD